jgi:hypothetical protein
MSYRHLAQLKLTLCRALVIAALPTACAVGVEPDFGDSTDPGDTGGGGAGVSSGGTLPLSGSTTGGQAPKAGSPSTNGGTSSPFGGSASTGGKGGSASGGGGGGGTGGSSTGGTAGSSRGGTGGSSTGGTGGSSAGGTGGGTCACPKTLVWADNTNLSFVSGDCLDVAGKIYLYTGTKAQTWANKDCNPTMQLAWCTDVGADYKFALCK